jgi:hypothetical protein
MLWCDFACGTTMDGQELLPRQSLRESSKIKGGDLCTVRATVKPKSDSANSSMLDKSRVKSLTKKRKAAARNSQCVVDWLKLGPLQET